MRKGFTVIEILVVVAIIGILASVVLFGVDSAKRKARDARRVADLSQMAQVIEIYNNDNGEYPSDLNADLSQYFPQGVPNDPVPSKTYNYVHDGSQCYVLRAELDRDNRSILDRDLDGEIDCGGIINCNDSEPPYFYCVGDL